ncbi:MAG: histidine--tRNA ligase [Candidatus Diapherotrites archaeon]|nr:histidine--tRNA ligase [Candidatus Diapherotrites archaeon]
MEFQTVRGMRDLIGEDALLQQRIEDTIRNVAEKYGYAPLYTPAVESFDLFKAKGGLGEEIRNEIYCFKDKGERELALRFELTASLARIAARSQLKMPFKRYQIGEVYRYDRPQAKRYRAFTQADIDILGVKGLKAELELMLIIRDIFSQLNLKPKVVFNSRNLLQELLSIFGKGKEVEAMRIIDKMEKIGAEEVKKELKNIGVYEKIVDLIKSNSIEEVSKIGGMGSSTGLKEVNDFIEIINANGLDFVELDLSLARGLDYYTGLVFEIKAGEGPSIGGGGRFDKLIEAYGGNPTPAVGIGFGVSRILDFMKEKGEKTEAKGIFLFGLGVPYGKVLSVAQTLRNRGINVENDLSEKSISKNLECAQKKRYSFAGIIGERELKKNVITLKNINNGKQILVSVEKVEDIKKFMSETSKIKMEPKKQDQKKIIGSGIAKKAQEVGKVFQKIGEKKFIQIRKNPPEAALQKQEAQKSTEKK